MLPLYNRIQDGSDSYATPALFVDALSYARRKWSLYGDVVSYELPAGGIVKRLTSMGDHAATETIFGDLMEALYSRGIVRPSSYGDIFAQSAQGAFPRVRWSVNAALVRYFRAGWQEARVRGLIEKPLRKYDMNSAYFWSLSLGLPDPRTFHPAPSEPVFSDGRGRETEAIYVIEMNAHPDLPYPFNRPSKYYMASTEEIETYSLDVRRYHLGVAWRAMRMHTEWQELIQSFPCAKQIMRSYWGRWASQAHVKLETRAGKHAELPHFGLNLVWAHCIVSRVKMRMWRACPNLVHAYVDSVITQDIMPVGVEYGDWRLIAEYPDGLEIDGPGNYGRPGEPREKHAGKVA